MQIFLSALLYLVSLSQYLHKRDIFVLFDFTSNLEKKKKRKKKRKKKKMKQEVASVGVVL